MEVIKKETVDFLSRLKKNNNHEWFNNHKEDYQKALDNFTSFIAELISRISGFDKTVAGVEPKKSIFRIYRDTRFSNDKIPYKINFSANIAGDEEKCGNAGYYIHLQPGSVFLAGGVHTPEPDRLKGIREEISYNADLFKKIIQSKSFKEHFKEIWGEKLKTTPKGFDKEDPMMSYLQFKDFVIKNEVPDKTVLNKDFQNYCLDIFREMKPFNDFINAPVTKIK